MFMNVICPSCGKKCRILESALGSQVQCPHCAKYFQCGTSSPPSLKTKPVPAVADNVVQAAPRARTASAKVEEIIHYRCSRCSKSLESPVQMGGQKVNCPDCGQRLQIPIVQATVPVSAVVVQSQAVPASKTKKPKAAVPVVLPAPEPTRVENCLECGVDVTERRRVQTCPDCGSLFCSAKCFREHRYHAHPSSR